MKIAYYRGEGYGFYGGITEYVVLLDDESAEDHLAPGFTVESVTETVDLPISLPLNTTLVPK